MATAIDFGSIAATNIKPDEIQTKRAGRKRSYEGTPVLDWVRESANEGVGKSVPVPTEQATALIGMIRSAASIELDKSVKVQRVDHDGGQSTILFIVVPKRAYTRKAEKSAKK